jgi:threonine/homoserine/homoserine lactone efflux protein
MPASLGVEMPELSTLAVFAVAALVLLVVPGPSVLYIVTRSIDQGRMAGVVSVLGVHIGSLVHIAAAALGLSALLMSSALAFATVRYLGAAYLIYLGVRTLRERGEVERSAEVRTDRLTRVLSQGVIVNVLNPKTALFFLAFLPQFVDPSRGSVAFQIGVLGAFFVLLGMISDGTYALLAAAAGRWLRGNLRFGRLQRYFSGGVYLTLGTAAALSGSNSASK